MTSYQYLICRLSPYIQSTLPAVGQPIPLKRFALLEDQNRLEPDCVYLGDPETARRILPGIVAEGQVPVILTGSLEEPVLPATGRLLVLSTQCTLPRLCNMLTDIFARAVQWMAALADLVQRSADLQHLLAQASEISGTTLALVNTDRGVMAAAGLTDTSLLAGQARDPAGLERTIRDIFAGAEAGPSTHIATVKGRCVYGRRIDLSDFHGVLLAESGKDGDLDCGGFCDLLADAVGRMLFHPAPLNPQVSIVELERFFAQVMEGADCDPDRLRELLDSFPFPAGPFLRLMVVTLESGQVPVQYTMIQLRQIFPHSVMVAYRKSVVILYTYEKRAFSPNLDSQRLRHLLEQYNGFVGISNGTRDWRKLRSLYLLAVQSARVAKEFRTGERIFFYEDYGMYCVIDLCAQKFVELHGHDDILYLVHPAVVHISRHDRINRDNLRDVLFYYLLSDRNVVKTAAAAYMHRNTVLKKVARISELLDIDFEDGELRYRLLFSCQVIRYYESYMKQKLRL